MQTDSSASNSLLEKVMKANVGGLDRGLRISMGLVLLSLVVIGPQSWWGLLGLVPLATGLMSFCPLYTLLGINSCPRN